MKSRYSIFLLKRSIEEKHRIQIHPLVFKYKQLLRKALLFYSEGTIYTAFHLWGEQIPYKEIPVISIKSRWL